MNSNVSDVKKKLQFSHINSDLSIDMKTKVVQHVESEWIREWKSESVRVRHWESEIVWEWLVRGREWLLSIDMKTKVVQYDESEWMRDCEIVRVRVWESESVREWECERVIWFPAFVWHSDIFFLSSQCSRSWNSSPIFTFTSSIIEHNEHSLINTSTIQPPLLSSKSRWRFFNQNIDKFVWNKWPESLSPARIFSSPLINTSLKSVYYIEARFHN